MLSAGRVIGVLVLVKSVDVGLRGPQDLPAPFWVLSLVLLVSGGLLLTTALERAGWAALLAGCVVAAADFPPELRWQHLFLLLLVALAALVARDDAERLLLWRVQVSALYGTAAVAKLNGSYLGGDVLAGVTGAAPLGSGLLPEPPLVLLLVAGVGLIGLEVLIAVTPWVRRLHGIGLLTAGVFHVVAVPLAGTDPLVALRLVVFGGTSLVLLAACTGRLAPSAPIRSQGAGAQVTRA